MRGLRILLLSTLLFVPGLLKAAPGQFSISVDALGQWAYMPSSIYSTPAAGFLLFADYRPMFLPFLSLGLQVGAAEYFKGNGFQTTWVDLAGRIFPIEASSLGQFYLQGGFGVAPLERVLPEHWQGAFHGNAGIGYALTTVENQALDVGIQYDIFSPRLAPLDNLGVKVGYTWFFGDSAMKDTEEIKLHQMIYAWQPKDSLESVAKHFYGDGAMFPMIVDANPEMAHPYDLRVGIRIRIPKFPPQELWSLIHAKSQKAAYQQWTLQGVKAFQYEQHLRIPKKGARHVWREGDDLQALAFRYYGDENFYPLIVDANEKRLILPVSLRPGVSLVIPQPPAEDKLGAVEDKAWDSKYIMWLNVSRRR